MDPLPLHLRAQARAARALMRLPTPAIEALLGGHRVERDGCVLDPRCQLLLALARRLGRGLGALDEPIPEQRARMEHEALVFAPRPPPIGSVYDVRVNDRVTARVHRPLDARRPSPAMVYVHGGGFVEGSLDSHEPVARAIAHGAGCVVFSVDYRLAPEHPFPAAADDVTAAFRWVVANAARFGVDPARVAIGGDSAGGNLSAVTALDTRGDARPPCFQALLYPMVDATQSFPSIAIMAEGFLLEKPRIDWFRAQYAPREDQWTDPRLSPWFAPDVEGAAPALIQTAGFDPLRDEAEAYAVKLRDAGVAVTARRYPSLIHGYLHMAGDIPAARGALDDLTAALRAAFA
ncbi:MAG: alpha/beta hydrolase [Polyangiales bacterium]